MLTAPELAAHGAACMPLQQQQQAARGELQQLPQMWTMPGGRRQPRGRHAAAAAATSRQSSTRLCRAHVLAACELGGCTLPAACQCRRERGDPGPPASQREQLRNMNLKSVIAAQRKVDPGPVTSWRVWGLSPQQPTFTLSLRCCLRAPSVGLQRLGGVQARGLVGNTAQCMAGCVRRWIIVVQYVPCHLACQCHPEVCCCRPRGVMTSPGVYAYIYGHIHPGFRHDTTHAHV